MNPPACLRCRHLEDENERLRDVVEALWADLQTRYRMASGRFEEEPVPPLLMASRDLFQGAA